MMDQRRLIPFLLALVAAAPVAAVALWSLSQTVADLSDPCATWESSSEPAASIQMGPHDPCAARSFHGAKIRTVTRAALVPGLLLIASILGLSGAVLSRPRFLFVASIVMFFATPVVFTIAPLTLFAAFGFLFLGTRLQGTGAHTA
jgi:hypothetical protein